jgi:two-component system LytT family response regulator
MTPLTVVVVEDEPVARRALGSALAALEGVCLAGEAADGPSAIDLVDRVTPDVVFLDVRLPGCSGIEVLGRLVWRPAVVFTTAWDTYAISALQLGAVDYVVKPFGPARVAEALDRVRHRLVGEPGTALRDRVREVVGAPTVLRRVFVREAHRIVPVVLSEVSHVEASDDYVTLHVGGRTHLVEITMAELERRLDPHRFVRVHRSWIVNLDFVAAVARGDERRLEITLRDGVRITASRAGSARLRQLLA